MDLNTLVSNINDIIEDKTGYSEMIHFEAEKNAEYGLGYKISINEINQNEDSGKTRFVTYDITMSINLTEECVSNELQSTAEAIKRQLIEYANDIYLECHRTKAGTPNAVIGVFDFTTSDIELNEDSNYISYIFDFTVKIRESL